MNPSRWQKVEEIFNAAVDLAPEERGGFLSAACGGDEELRAQIERLLRADEKETCAPTPFYRRLSPLQWSGIAFVVLLLPSVSGFFSNSSQKHLNPSNMRFKT